MKGRTNLSRPVYSFWWASESLFDDCWGHCPLAAHVKQAPNLGVPTAREKQVNSCPLHQGQAGPVCLVRILKRVVGISLATVGPE